MNAVSFLGNAFKEQLFQALTGCSILDANSKKLMRYMRSYLQMSATCHALRMRISACWMEFLNAYIDKRIAMTPEWLHGSYPDMKKEGFHLGPVRWISGNKDLMGVKVENISLKSLVINQEQKLEVYGIWPGNQYDLDAFYWCEVNRFEKTSLKAFKPVFFDHMSEGSFSKGIIYSTHAGDYGDWLFLDEKRNFVAHIIGTQEAKLPRNIKPLFIEKHCFILVTGKQKCQLRSYGNLKKQQADQVWDLPFSHISSMHIFQQKLLFVFYKEGSKHIAMTSIENVETSSLDFIYWTALPCHFRLIEMNGEILMVSIHSEATPLQIQRLIFHPERIEFVSIEIKGLKDPITYIQGITTLWDRLFILGKSDLISSCTYLFHINLTTGELERETACGFSRDLNIEMIANPKGRVHFAWVESNQSFLKTLDFT